MAKYFTSLLRYFCFYTLAFLVFLLLNGAIREILCELLPTLFPPYNPVTEKELYFQMAKNTALVTAFICIFLASYAAVAFDSIRYERVISKTDGFYRIKNALPSYLLDFLPADIIGSAISPLPLLLLTLFSFPENVTKHTDKLFALTEAFTGKFGTLSGFLMIFLFSLASRLVIAPIALRRFRGMWLADVE